MAIVSSEVVFAGMTALDQAESSSHKARCIFLLVTFNVKRLAESY